MIVEEYLSTEELIVLDKLISSTAPHLNRRMMNAESMPMIGYGEIVCKKKSSSREWPLLAIAQKKSYISIFVAGEKEGVPLCVYYRDKNLGRIGFGKNCIKIRNIAHLEKDVFCEMIKDAIKWQEEEHMKTGQI